MLSGHLGSVESYSVWCYPLCLACFTLFTFTVDVCPVGLISLLKSKPPDCLSHSLVLGFVALIVSLHFILFYYNFVNSYLLPLQILLAFPSCVYGSVRIWSGDRGHSHSNRESLTFRIVNCSGKWSKETRRMQEGQAEVAAGKGHM